MLSQLLLRLLYVTTTGGLAPYLKFLPVLLDSSASVSGEGTEDGEEGFSPRVVGLILLVRSKIGNSELSTGQLQSSKAEMRVCRHVSSSVPTAILTPANKTQRNIRLSIY